MIFQQFWLSKGDQMKKLLPLIGIVILVAFVSASAQGPNANAPFTKNTFATVSSVTSTPILQLPIAYTKHTIQWKVAGGPSGCSLTLQGTIVDNPTSSDMVDIGTSQTCTSGGMSFVVDKPVTGVAVNVTVLTNGTNPAVTVTYLGTK